MRKPVVWLLAALAGTCAAWAGQDTMWHGVRGKALEALFADQDLGDGVHYSDQFHRDGRLTGMNMGKPARGTWKVDGRYLCYTWEHPKSEDECYEVRQRGKEVRMFRDGYEAFSGILTPLQPRIDGEAKP